MTLLMNLAIILTVLGAVLIIIDDNEPGVAVIGGLGMLSGMMTLSSEVFHTLM